MKAPVIFRKVPEWNTSNAKARPAKPATLIKNLEGGKKLLQLPNGKEITVDYQEYTVFRIVPKSKIPSYWKEVIKLNPKAKITVVFLDHTDPECTTIVCSRTLDQIRSVIRSEETADIKLWKGDSNASEGKPQITDSDTVYLCGSQEIELPETNRYE